MNFNQCFDFVIGAEGGYSNDPKDPGGETKYGISKRAFPNLDIKNLTLDQAKEIYKKHYWDLAKCEQLPEKLRLCMFDCAVNQGASTAAKLLQRAGNVTQDGIIGKNTLKACERDDILERFLGARAERYAKTNNFDVYGFGWNVRLFTVAKASYLGA